MKQNSQRGGVVAAILIGMALVAILAIAGLLFTGWIVARNVRVTEDRSRGVTRVETPFGSMRVKEGSKFDPRRFGVPVYPGAVRLDDHRKLASLEFDFGDTHKDLVIIAAEYTTPDSIEKVRDYYRDKLPGWLITEKPHGTVQIEINDNGQKRIVAIKKKDGATHIALASIGEPAAN